MSDILRRRSDLQAPTATAPGGTAGGALRAAQRLVEFGLRCDRSGRLDEAIGAYEAAIAAAEGAPADRSALAEALRRLAVLSQRRGEPDRALELAARSLEVAVAAGDVGLRAEALNTLGGLALTRGHLDEAQRQLTEALAFGERLPELRGRIEQNLGILHNMRGDRATALAHYDRSLQAFLAAGDHQRCAVAYHNLGMISSDQLDWEAASQYFEQGRRAAQDAEDDHLRGLCLMNRMKALTALKRFDAAQLAGETALSIFEELRAPGPLADVQRMLGVVFRETGRLSLAQQRLELAVELSGESGSPASQSEALCEAGRLHARLGHLDQASDLLGRATARLSDSALRLAGPEIARGDYPAIVVAWCELLRARDADASDREDRVAALAATIAEALELPVAARAFARLTAQLCREAGTVGPMLRSLAAGDGEPRAQEVVALAADFDARLRGRDGTAGVPPEQALNNVREDPRWTPELAAALARVVAACAREPGTDQ